MKKDYWIAFLLLLIFILIGILLYQRKLRNHALIEQGKVLKQHVEEVESIYQQMRGWRHDYKNHLQTMKAYIELNRVDKLKGYLSELDEDLISINVNFQTGNTMGDAILNSKFSLASARGIRLTAKANIPSNLLLNNVELGTLLGNLLSNAIDACLKIEKDEERFIRVYITPIKSQLYISITNSMAGEVKKQGNLFLTTKKGKEHGFGLKRIDKTVGKYGGIINRQYEEGVFVTEVFFPL